MGGTVASQSMPSHYPIYEASALNGLPSVRFTGSAALCLPSGNAVEAALNSSDYTVFIVFRTLGKSPNRYGALLGASNGCCGQFWFYADGFDVGEYNTFTPIPYAKQTSYSTLGGSAFRNGTYSSADGALQIVYVNGGSVQTSASAPRGTGGNPICIGVTNTDRYVNAEIFDIVIWDVPLTPVQYKQAQIWADRRYGQPDPWSNLSAYNVFFGDSITAGSGVAAPTDTAPYLAAKELGLSLGQWDNVAVGGITTANMNELAFSWVDPLPTLLRRQVNLIGFEWFNEKIGKVPPIPFTDAQRYLNARRLVQNLKIVWGTSTSYSGDPDKNREAYDQSFDNADKSNVDSYVPLHKSPDIGVAGPQSSFSRYPENWSDGIHLSATGYHYLAAEFVKGISSLP